MSVADRGDDRHQAREAIVGEDGHVLVESPSIPMAVCDLSVISRLGECPSAAVALTREQAKAVAAALDPALVAERDRYETALRKIGEQQQKTLGVLQANGVVFDGPLGNDPDNWQHVAFSIYTDLCKVDTWAKHALDEGFAGSAGSE